MNKPKETKHMLFLHMSDTSPAKNRSCSLSRHFIKKSITAFFCWVCFIFFSKNMYAQSGTVQNRITVIEKADYSTYINGTYIGLTYREARFYLIETEIKETDYSIFNYEGEAFVTGQTRKNMRGTALPIDTVLPIAFTLNMNPVLKRDNPYQLENFSEDAGYPILRTFPVLPGKDFTALSGGEKWMGKSTIAVCPKADKKAVRIPVYPEFEYKGKTLYNGITAYWVRAVFAVRYNGTDAAGDVDMVRSDGGRTADIYFDENGKLLFIKEKLEEEFFYSDGTRIKRRGFMLHFYTYSGKNKTVYTAHGSDMEREGTDSEQDRPLFFPEDFDITETKRGTVLNLKNLNFAADKAVLLPGEEKKLAEIAGILKVADAAFFYVEGHTADIGEPEAQKQLSLERAKVITEVLIKFGIASDKFVYGGVGGTKPLAPNNTEEGRAKNRRVEITIIK